jgi:hypothetical protein
VIHGFGILDVSCEGGVRKNPHYGVWSRMIERCYSPKSLLRNSQYIVTEVCEDWRLFSKFQEWSSENYVDGWTLDKDVIDLTGETYSPLTCCFLPQEVNKSILDSSAARSEFGLGVWYKKPTKRMVNERKKPYVAEINNTKIGSFTSAREAHRAWQESKVSSLVQTATDWTGKIDDRAILGLVKRAYLIELDIKNKSITHSVSRMEV